MVLIFHETQGKTICDCLQCDIYCVISFEKMYLLVQSSDITLNFYVLLTVHLSIILDNDQLDTHLLYFTIRLL